MKVPWIVPRKTYRDFHADIFPDTASVQPVMVCSNYDVDDNGDDDVDDNGDVDADVDGIESIYGVFHDRVPAVGPQEGQAASQPFH